MPFACILNKFEWVLKVQINLPRLVLAKKMNKFFKAVLLTGLFAGTTDLVSAFVTVFIKSGKFPERMFNYIAGGALGLDTSLKGGVGVAFLGLFFHYFIACSFTLFFFWVFPRVKVLRFNKYLVGMLYAVFVNCVMERLVLPLTPLGGGSFDLPQEYIGWVVFGVLFGIPIVVNTYKYYGVE
jgi:putative transposon-encoded protein